LGKRQRLGEEMEAWGRDGGLVLSWSRGAESEGRLVEE